MMTVKEKIGQLKEQRDQAIADANRFIILNDALIEDCENLQNKLEQAETLWKATAKTLQAEIDRLRVELADERDRYDRLSDFELAEAKELKQVKTMFNIAFSYLDQTGYDMDKLCHIVALRFELMKRGLV